MVARAELQQHLERLFADCALTDYCPNGLQVAGRNNINKIVVGVTACQALLDIAVEQQTDAIIVHHGYFWKGENPCITGIKQTRLATLLNHDINLFAYHLPLDVHPELGNNAQLAKQLNFTIDTEHNQGLLNIGRSQCNTLEQLAEHIGNVLARKPQVIAVDNPKINAIAWCTGAAQDMIEQAAELGADVFISGEISERTFHLAKEYNIHYLAAGHHATERYGIQALGQHLSEAFELDVEYVDIDNPV